MKFKTTTPADYQRELAQREPGPPPKGVQVMAVPGVDGPAETRFVVRRRSFLASALLTLVVGLLLWGLGNAVVDCFRAADLPADLPPSFRSEWQFSEVGRCLFFLPVLAVFSGFWLYALFGGSELRLVGSGVIYRRGLWKFVRTQSCVLSADTIIRQETREIEQAGHHGVPRKVLVQGISVRNPRFPSCEAFFGEDLTPEVRAYLVHHLVRAADGIQK